MEDNTGINKRQLIKRFFIKAGVFYLLWQILYLGIVRPNGHIDQFLTNLVISGTVTGLNVLGLESTNIVNIVYIGNIAAVRVENQCNGLELLALFVGFLICFPGKSLPKLIVSIIGSILLFITNIIREILLSLNYVYFESSFNINHKYTYTIVVYFIVFLIWKYWIKNFSIVSKNA
ncbi:exosortase/archaeosortase family protein [Flavobacteriaceae bacterium MAR_2010_188]|nr:exosortase/archaeosortase family protein [Flavobacteriaceae bacterium MAR_2010_188]